jgi:hypothetical protein
VANPAEVGIVETHFRVTGLTSDGSHRVKRAFSGRNQGFLGKDAFPGVTEETFGISVDVFGTVGEVPAGGKMLFRFSEGVLRPAGRSQKADEEQIPAVILLGIMPLTRLPKGVSLDSLAPPKRGEVWGEGIQV